jgi:predicted RNA binding protein YcfA (HicA-like mRNA interferase family)
MVSQFLLKRCKLVSKLKSLDYTIVLKALVNIGYMVNNQKGSHIVMRFVDKQKYITLFGCRKNEIMVVVPAHKPLGKGMLRTIIREIALLLQREHIIQPLKKESNSCVSTGNQQ